MGEVLRHSVDRTLETSLSDDRDCLQELSHMFRFEPSNLVKSHPKFAGFVDIDLACLLAISLAKLLADSQVVKA